MRNPDVAAIFFEMSDLLWLRGGERYRSRAFWRAGRVIEQLAEPLASMIRKRTLEKVRDIGDGTIHRVKQILRTGTCDDHRKLLAEIPPGVREVSKVRGIGPRRLKVLWQVMRVGSVDELEAAALTGKLETLPVFGAGDVQRLMAAIREYREHRGRGRMPMPQALVEAEDLVAAVRELPGVVQAEIAGSLRRRKETTKDVDVIVAAEGPGVVREFMSMRDVGEVIIGDTGRASVRLQSGLQADVRVLMPEQFGAGMHYFTGSKDHNIHMRMRAKRRRRHLCEHGVYLADKETLVNACADETEVFHQLGLAFIPPELREGMGEIRAAETGTLPDLVTAERLRGDLRTSGDADAIAEAALARGDEYVVIIDAPEALREAMRARGLHVLRGGLVKIRADGTLDRALAELVDYEFVVAEPVPHPDLPFSLLTSRIVRAIESGVVDCIARPTGRQFGVRDAAHLDLERIFAASRRARVAIEVSGEPDRLDLDALAVRHAIEMNATLALNSGATSADELANRRFALFNARRGWATPPHVLNCQPVECLLTQRHQRLLAARFTPGWTPPVEATTDVESAAINPTTATPVSADLVEQLAAPVSDELRDRLQNYLQAGEDAELQAALASMGPNPLQVAFNLLVVSGHPSNAQNGA